MERRALVTINVGEVLCPNARRSFEAAAARWKADYVELNGPCTPDAPSPNLLKFELFRLCAADRAFYIDGGDAIIRSDAPSPFDLCPPTHLAPSATIRTERPTSRSSAISRKSNGAVQPLPGHAARLRLVFQRRSPGADARDARRDARPRAPAGRAAQRPRRLVRWQDQTFLNYAAVDLGVPILLMDETWNYMQPEDIGHWNGMERFVYHFAGSPGRGKVLPSLDWRRGRPRPARVVCLSRDAQGRRKSTARGRRGRASAAASPRAETHPGGDLPAGRSARHSPRSVARSARPVRTGHAGAIHDARVPVLVQPAEGMPRWHRKLWEYVMICQALWERGMLRAGRRGCGFGVGQEPLPALFASLGCEVLAADAPAEPRAGGARENARNILAPGGVPGARRLSSRGHDEPAGGPRHVRFPLVELRPAAPGRSGARHRVHRKGLPSSPTRRRRRAHHRSSTSRRMRKP